MSAEVYFLLAAAIVLVVAVVFLRRETRRSFNEERHATEEDAPVLLSWDQVTSELSARIFDREDSDFVARESSGQIARSFRIQRAGLALDWLLQVRKHVNLLMRAHLRAARGNPSLKPSGELSLGFEFLLFQVTCGIFYLVIWLVGPLHAAALVGYSLRLAGQLRKMTEDILPDGTQVAVELLESKSQAKNGTAAF
jgi:hypothetical protein